MVVRGERAWAASSVAVITFHPCPPVTLPATLPATGVAPPEAAAASPLAAGMAPRPPRLYWVPAVGLVSAIDHYRQAAGLAAVPQVHTVDAAAVTLAAMGEEEAPGQVRGSADAVAAAAEGLQRLELGRSGFGSGQP